MWLVNNTRATNVELRGMALFVTQSRAYAWLQLNYPSCALQVYSACYTTQRKIKLPLSELAAKFGMQLWARISHCLLIRTIWLSYSLLCNCSGICTCGFQSWVKFDLPKPNYVVTKPQSQASWRKLRFGGESKALCMLVWVALWVPYTVRRYVHTVWIKNYNNAWYFTVRLCCLKHVVRSAAWAHILSTTWTPQV